MIHYWSGLQLAAWTRVYILVHDLWSLGSQYLYWFWSINNAVAPTVDCKNVHFWFLLMVFSTLLGEQAYSQWKMCTTWQMKSWRWSTLTIPMWWPWSVFVWVLGVDQALWCHLWKMEVYWTISGETRRTSLSKMTKTLKQWGYTYRKPPQ